MEYMVSKYLIRSYSIFIICAENRIPVKRVESSLAGIPKI